MPPAAVSIPFRPLICADLELSDPAAPHRLAPGEGLALLVRLHGDPIGDLVVEPAQVAAGVSSWLLAACDRFESEIATHLVEDRLVAASQHLDAQELSRACAQRVDTCSRRLVPTALLPKALLAVCTIGRHQLLPKCIEALLTQDYEGEFRVAVIDNAPTTNLARDIVEKFNDSRLQIVSAPFPGLSFARNVALRVAQQESAELILYTDDDAIADPGWLRSKVAVFTSNTDVGAVTGLVIAGSLASEAEQLFEEGSGFNKGHQRRIWSKAPPSSSVWTLGPPGDRGTLFPFAAGSFGSGNSISFRTDVLHELGGFDVALGAGTLTQGGEDLDIFVRVILSGRTLVYEPRAVIRHYHRDTYVELLRQMTNYGTGLSAFLFREFLKVPQARVDLLRVIPQGLKRMFATDSQKNESRTTNYPKELIRAEYKGFLKGPWLYLRADARARKVARACESESTDTSDSKTACGL